MKRIPALALVLALLASATLAQATGHSATLTWTAPPDATATTIYHIYRAAAACPTGGGVGTLSFVRVDGVSSAISSTNYTDTTIGVGPWCWYVTAVTGGQESAPSNTSGGTALPNAPVMNVPKII